MKIVSFLIPCHNDAARLPAAVASCLAQGVKCELTVVADCSSDNSFEVAQGLPGRHPEHVRVFRAGKNAGSEASS